jgi:abhydrolase domain-containing protein 1/3
VCVCLVSREILTLADGGEVALDWGVLNTESARDSEGVDGTIPPVLLILAGITGSSADNYVQHLVEDGLLEGYAAVVFNQRGNGGIQLKVSGIHHLG